MIIKDIIRDYFSGIGKPEPLKGNLSGWWSRRIDDSNLAVVTTNREKFGRSYSRREPKGLNSDKIRAGRKTRVEISLSFYAKINNKIRIKQ